MSTISREAVMTATEDGVKFNIDDILHNRLEKGFMTDSEKLSQ